MQSRKTDRPNPGIRCQVNTCFYYMNGDLCTADRIEVLSRDAHNTDETNCNTFAKK
jgi:hypothetical protein